MVAGDLVNTASPDPGLADPAQVLVGRLDPARDRADDRLRGRRRARAEGQDRPAPPVRGRCAWSRAPAARCKSEGLEAPFVGRDRELRQIKDMFHACADERRAAPGLGDRDRRHRQVAPGVGVLQVLRRPRPGDLLAPRPLPLLRRGRHLLGAGRHGAHALPDQRGRAGGLGRREAAGGARRAHPRRRTSASSSSRGWPSCSGMEGGGRFEREDLFSAWRRLLRAAGRRLPDGARLRGHAVGGRVAARLHRVPARVVAQLARST